MGITNQIKALSRIYRFQTVNRNSLTAQNLVCFSTSPDNLQDLAKKLSQKIKLCFSFNLLHTKTKLKGGRKDWSA